MRLVSGVETGSFEVGGVNYEILIKRANEFCDNFISGSKTVAKIDWKFGRITRVNGSWVAEVTFRISEHPEAINLKGIGQL